MRIDWTTQYFSIMKLTHDIMFQPFLDKLLHQNKIDEIKPLSRKIKNEAWYDNKEPTLEIYKKYYQKYWIYNKNIKNRNYNPRFPEDGDMYNLYCIFDEQVEKAKVMILWDVQLWTRIDMEKLKIIKEQNKNLK